MINQEDEARKRRDLEADVALDILERGELVARGVETLPVDIGEPAALDRTGGREWQDDGVSLVFVYRLITLPLSFRLAEV